MLEWNVIRTSTSCYQNPLLVFPKTNKSLRVCGDFRSLNRHIPLLRTKPLDVQEILQKFHGVKWFAQINLTAGYWQLPLTEESKPLTAFYFENQLNELKVSPFGNKTEERTNTSVLIDCNTGKESVPQHVDNLRVWQCSNEKKEEWIPIMNQRLKPEASTSKE